MARLREVGELEALRRLIRDRAAGPGVIVGPGDDAAVLRPTPGVDLVATTDALVAGRHYLAEWITPEELGARLAAANLSDLAAMAATPRWALLETGVGAERRATAFGIYHTVVGLALLPASALAGWLWDRFGARATFAVDGALALLAALLFVALLPARAEHGDRQRGAAA